MTQDTPPEQPDPTGGLDEEQEPDEELGTGDDDGLDPSELGEPDERG